jgi:hypothetical protein
MVQHVGYQREGGAITPHPDLRSDLPLKGGGKLGWAMRLQIHRSNFPGLSQLARDFLVNDPLYPVLWF